jgi:hypothetical protein
MCECVSVRLEKFLLRLNICVFFCHLGYLFYAFGKSLELFAFYHVIILPTPVSVCECMCVCLCVDFCSQFLDQLHLSKMIMIRTVKSKQQHFPARYLPLE